VDRLLEIPQPLLSGMASMSDGEIELRGSGWLRTAHRGEHGLGTVLSDGALYHVRITGSDDRIVCQDLAHALREIGGR